MTPTIEKDLLSLLAYFEQLERDYDGAQSELLMGKQQAFGHTSKKIRELLKWHGTIPGGMPVRS